jgi:hypothetical protein
MVAKIKDITEFRQEMGRNGYSERKLSIRIKGKKYPGFINRIVHKQKTSIASAYSISQKLNVPFEKHFELVPR